MRKQQLIFFFSGRSRHTILQGDWSSDVCSSDLTPLLLHPALFREVIGWMAEGWTQVDRIAAMESRGFLFAAPLVEPLQAGLALARKKGKLPYADRKSDVQGEKVAHGMPKKHEEG